MRARFVVGAWIRTLLSSGHIYDLTLPQRQSPLKALITKISPPRGNHFIWPHFERIFEYFFVSVWLHDRRGGPCLSRSGDNHRRASWTEFMVTETKAACDVFYKFFVIVNTLYFINWGDFGKFDDKGGQGRGSVGLRSRKYGSRYDAPSSPLPC